MSFGFEAPLRLRLGAVPWAEAAPLTAGLHGHPDHDFRLASAEELAAALQERTLDAALLPPLVALQLEGVRLVPGIALCLPATGEVPDSGPWQDDQAAAALNLTSPTSLSSIHTVWASQAPALPLVLLVWACRPRAPYPAIRRTLITAARATDLPPQGPHFHHGLGSEESDSLRALIRLAQGRGGLPAGTDVYYC